MKSSGYPLLVKTPLYGLPPLFLHDNLDSPFYDFSKIPTPVNKAGGDSNYVQSSMSRSPSM